MSDGIPMRKASILAGDTFVVSFSLNGVTFQATCAYEKSGKLRLWRMSMTAFCYDVEDLFDEAANDGVSFSNRFYDAMEEAAKEYVDGLLV